MSKDHLSLQSDGEPGIVQLESLRSAMESYYDAVVNFLKNADEESYLQQSVKDLVENAPPEYANKRLRDVLIDDVQENKRALQGMQYDDRDLVDKIMHQAGEYMGGMSDGLLSVFESTGDGGMPSQDTLETIERTVSELDPVSQAFKNVADLAENMDFFEYFKDKIQQKELDTDIGLERARDLGEPVGQNISIISPSP